MRKKTEAGTPMERMLRHQVIDRGVRDERVLSAMRATPRERFFPKEARDDAYADQATSIGHGQTISQPYIVALMTEHLQVEPGMKVLELGTGSGYQTAILARLGGEIYTIERVKPLLDQAFERVLDMGLRNVHFRFGDGTEGWPEAAPFDRILIAAGAPRLPRELLLGQLAEDGIAVLPVGPDDHQMLVEVRRKGDDLISRDVCPCKFVKLIGKEGWQVEAKH
jgi:protein-L-isoaspartate(D-aspartate) O-methyltransferase